MKRLQLLIKISLFLILGSTLIGCEDTSTDTFNKIVFERYKKLGVSEALKKEKKL
ncbi:MAG: hypothetical protein AB1422_07330 [bacterium]